MSRFNRVSTPSFTSLLIAGALLAAASQASAATVRVQCEKRADRSTVSVDGKNLVAGSYTAVVVSGGNSAAAPARSTVGDEVEFDFNSQPNDIRAGATAIPATFVTGASVTGKIVDSLGNTVIADTVACRVRSR